MSWAGILLLVGMAVLILIYLATSSIRLPLSNGTVRMRTDRRRSRLPIREIMAVLCSIVFSVWALYVLMAHPDSIIGGPIYDPATKQAATGALGAILGLWLGKSVE